MALVRAQYGSAVFSLEESEFSTGRRSAVTQMPFADAISVSDTGRKPWQYKLTAYLVGTDYLARRDALLTELEAGESSVLVHPLYGRIVGCRVVGDVTVKESTKQTGYCQITFTLATDALPQSAAESAQTRRTLQLTGQSAAAQGSELAAPSLGKAGAAVLAAAPAAIKSPAAKNYLQSLSSALLRAKGMADGVTGAVAGIASEINNIRNTASDLLNAPARLVAALAGVVASILSLGLLGTEALSAVRRLERQIHGLDAALPGANAPESLSESAAAQAGVALALQCVVIAAALDAMAEIEPESDAEATSLCALITQHIDAVHWLAEDVALFNALTLAREAVTAFAALGSATKRVTFAVPLPLPVVAYRTGVDIDLLMARNPALHPLSALSVQGVPA